MTEKQKRFVEEYLIDLNATQAAIRAGYSERSAYSTGERMLRNAEVKSYITEQLEHIRSQRTADAQEVIEYLSDVMRGKSRSHVLCLCGDGCQEVIDKPPDERERLKAAELLGKRYGIFTEKMDVEVQSSEKLDDILTQLGGKGLSE